MREFLIAMVLVSADCHSGQRDPWYTRGCLAAKYLLKWYQIRSAFDWMGATYISDQRKAIVEGYYKNLIEKHFGGIITPQTLDTLTAKR